MGLTLDTLKLRDMITMPELPSPEEVVMKQAMDGLYKKEMAVIEDILRHHIECPIEGELTREKVKAAVEAFKHIVDSDKNSFLEIFKAGAKWKEKQVIKDAIDATVFCESLKIPAIGHFLHKTNLKEKDKVKVIIIKSE